MSVLFILVLSFVISLSTLIISLIFAVISLIQIFVCFSFSYFFPFQ
jgi:hypothetical protein